MILYNRTHTDANMHMYCTTWKTER